MALYGYRGDLREDRADIVAGWTDGPSPLVDSALAEARWFLTELRAMNAKLAPGEPRLRWFGYDLSFRPGGGYVDARELLAPHGEDRLVQLILRQMELVPGESRIEEAARLERLVGMLDQGRAALTRLLGPAGALELRRALQRMADAFRFIDGLQTLGDYDPVQVKAALSARELRMAHNFVENLAGARAAGRGLRRLGHAPPRPARPAARRTAGPALPQRPRRDRDPAGASRAALPAAAPLRRPTRDLARPGAGLHLERRPRHRRAAEAGGLSVLPRDCDGAGAAPRAAAGRGFPIGLGG